MVRRGPFALPPTEIVSRLACTGADTRSALLIDPQTPGGLLTGVTAEQVERYVERLRPVGMLQPLVLSSAVKPRAGRNPSGS